MTLINNFFCFGLGVCVFLDCYDCGDNSRRGSMPIAGNSTDISVLRKPSR